MTFLVIGSCSSSTGSTTTASDPSNPEGVVVVTDEYSFSPAVLALAEPGLVELRNVGGLAHTWTVMAEPIDAESDLSGSEPLAETRVDMGQSATADISEILPGTYQVVCAIPGHFSAGMKGELIVGTG
jgi:plastocyanin